MSRGIELLSGNSAGARQRLALRDLGETTRLWRLVLTLGWLDIRLRYRGSLLGPFWLTLSTGVMVAALGFVYSTLFNQSLQDYLPFLALSLVLWNALNAVVSEACVVFTEAESTIRATRMPFGVQAARLLVRQALVLLHNVAVIVVVDIVFAVWPGATGLLAIPGLLLWTLDGMAACLLLGCFCARFRDVPQMVASVMQIAFFVTPIVWKPEQMKAGAEYLPYNPLYVLIEVVREPLIGNLPSEAAWASAGAWSAALCLAAWLLFSRVRGRLAFWM